MEDFRSARHETQEGGRTVITEPGRVIVRDPSGQAFIRHDEMDRFRFGARDIQTQVVGGETRTIVIRPDGTQIILPCLKTTTGDWLLMDLASSSVAQRVRTTCNLTTGPADVFVNWACDDPPDGEASTVGSYQPTSVGALFGAR